MAGLATGGFALSALPATPRIPDNIGKLDVNAIYDAAKKGMDTQEAFRTALARQQVTDEQLKAQRSAALAQQQVIPATAEEQVAQAHRGTALASPSIVGQEVAKTSTGLDADLASEQARRDNAKFLAGLTSPQRLVLASKGPSTGTTSTTMRDPKTGNVQSVNEETAYVGGQPVPLARGVTEFNPTPAITTLPGPNGTSGGSVITSVGPDGKTTTQHVVAPLAALNHINTGTTYKVLGTSRDDQGNPVYEVQGYTQSAAGGAPTPVGAPTKVNSIAGLPGIDANVQAQSNQPFISKDASKAIEDVQAELSTLNTRKVELQNISNAASAFTEDTTGKFVGPIRSFFGDSQAQEFVGAVQNALSTALQPLRGTGRVSNTEFNQALSALPRVTDTAETIHNKLQYLTLVTDWATARNQAILDNLGQGLTRYQAYQKAQKDVPVPEVPNFYAGATAAPGTPGSPGFTVAPAAAPAAAPAQHSQDSAAVTWAKAHPGDPRAAEILKLNGL